MKKVRLERRIQKILINTMIPMAALLAVFLGIMAQYVANYDRLSENLAVSSNFNLHFKDDLDLEMYYIAVGTMEAKHLSEVMPLVDEAEETIGKLKGNTTNHESRRSLERLEGYMTNLRKRMPQLTEIETFDESIGFMDNNIRILTSLIVEEMQNFIYQESMYLVKMEGAMTRGVYIMVGGLAVLLTIMIAVLLRRSFRLSRDITRPVTEILANVREVGRGNFEIPEVQADSVEIEELDSGIRACDPCCRNDSGNSSLRRTGYQCWCGNGSGCCCMLPDSFRRTGFCHPVSEFYYSGSGCRTSGSSALRNL